MGKDTVVIRAVVDDSVKKPVMRYPERVRYLQLQFVYAIPLPTHPLCLLFVVCFYMFVCLQGLLLSVWRVCIGAQFKPEEGQQLELCGGSKVPFPISCQQGQTEVGLVCVCV